MVNILQTAMSNSFSWKIWIFIHISLKLIIFYSQNKVILIPFIHNMCVWQNWKRPGAQIDSEKHSTGVTGLHS